MDDRVRRTDFRKGRESMDSKQFDDLVARLARGSTRRDALKGVAAGALGSVAGVATVASAKNDGTKDKKPKKAKKPKKKKCKGKGKDKVTICHKGQTISVSRCALKGHLGHGDTEGACLYG